MKTTSSCTTANKDAHGSVEFFEATPIGLTDESKEFLYGRETDRDLRST